jgi:hypothetical protein
MNWFWHAIWIFFVVIPVSILWIACIFDVVFNRNDLVWWKRLGWFAVVLVPFIGAIVYSFFTPMFHRDRDHAYDDEDELRARGLLTDTDRLEQGGGARSHLSHLGN